LHDVVLRVDKHAPGFLGARYDAIDA